MLLPVGETARAGRYGVLVYFSMEELEGYSLKPQSLVGFFLKFWDIGEELALHWIKFSCDYKLKPLDNAACEPVMYL